MATVTKTFNFATDPSLDTPAWGSSSGPASTLSWNSSLQALSARVLGRNKIDANYWEWVGTWEQLGVPAGSTVSAIQLTSGWTRVTEYATGASSNIGPYEVYDAAGTTLLAVLWAGRTFTTTDAGTAIASQSNVFISPTQPSNTQIRIRLEDTLKTGANNSAAVTALDDSVNLSITYTAGGTTVAATAPLTATSTLSGSGTVTPAGGPGPATIALSTLTSGGGSAATSHTTASVSPAANKLLMLWVHCYTSADAAQPTLPGISGLGLTWEQVGTDVIVDNSGTDRADVFLFRAMSPTTPTPGTITITPNSSQKATWILDQVDGVATGSNGANAILQFVKSEPGSVATITATLAAFQSPANAGYAGMASQNTAAKTWDNSWTKEAEVTTNSVTGLTTGYRLDGTQLTVSVTGTAARSGLGAVELAAAGAAGAGSAALNTASTLSAEPDATYPGFIGGVEPESHAHNPVYVDSNNNMYRITESSTESGNHPMCWKSTNGGKTWFEVDAAHRPTTQDMEGTWGMKVGTDIYYTTNRDDTVWLDVFHMSDSGTPDTWGLHETIDTGLTSTGVEQWSSFSRLSDGTFWMFYSDTMAGSNQQIAYRKRTATNTYDTKVSGAFGSTAVSYCGPSPVLGASDKTHIFYTDQTNNHVYYRTLTSTGTLSGATQIDSAGSFNFSTSPGRIAHTNPVYYDASGIEVIGVMFADTAGILKYASIRNGVVQTLETVSAAAVMHNPGTTTSDAIIAHLANDGGTVYAVWSDEVTGDVKLRVRTEGSGWGTETQLWDSGTNAAWYTYVDVITRGGTKKVGYVWDVTHVVDVSDLRYNEFSITASTANGTAGLTSSSTLSASGTVVSTAAGTASLSSTSTLSAAGVPAKIASANLSSTSTLSAAGVPAKIATATLTASSTLSASGVRTQPAAVALVASSTLSATGTAVGTSAATASLSATSTLSAVGVITRPAAAALSSSSTLAISGLRTQPAAAALSNTSTLSTSGAVTPFQYGSAALVATSTLSATGIASGIAGASASLSSTSTLSASGQVTRFGAVTLANISTLAASGVVTKLPAVAMAATSALSADGLVTKLSTAALSSSSTLAVSSVVTRSGGVTLVNTSILSAGGGGTVLATATLVATSTLTANGLRTQLAAVALTNSSTLAAAAVIARAASVALQATSTLSATGRATTFGIVQLVNTSTLSAFGSTGVSASPFKFWTGTVEQPMTMKVWNGTTEVAISGVTFV